QPCGNCDTILGLSWPWWKMAKMCKSVSEAKSSPWFVHRRFKNPCDEKSAPISRNGCGESTETRSLGEIAFCRTGNHADIRLSDSQTYGGLCRHELSGSSLFSRREFAE